MSKHVREPRTPLKQPHTNSPTFGAQSPPAAKTSSNLTIHRLSLLHHNTTTPHHKAPLRNIPLTLYTSPRQNRHTCNSQATNNKNLLHSSPQTKYSTCNTHAFPEHLTHIHQLTHKLLLQIHNTTSPLPKTSLNTSPPTKYSTPCQNRHTGDTHAVPKHLAHIHKLSHPTTKLS